MNEYVELAIEHYQDNIANLDKCKSGLIDMLVSSKDTWYLRDYLYDHYVRINGDYCPLCREYKVCPKCPIGEAGHSQCAKTPWEALHYLCGAGHPIESRRSAAILVGKIRKALEAEIAFLTKIDEG